MPLATSALHLDLQMSFRSRSFKMMAAISLSLQTEINAPHRPTKTTVISKKAVKAYFEVSTYQKKT